MYQWLLATRAVHTKQPTVTPRSKRVEHFYEYVVMFMCLFYSSDKQEQYHRHNMRFIKKIYLSLIEFIKLSYDRRSYRCNALLFFFLSLQKCLCILPAHKTTFGAHIMVLTVSICLSVWEVAMVENLSNQHDCTKATKLHNGHRTCFN